jgi:hypothetical protein
MQMLNAIIRNERDGVRLFLKKKHIFSTDGCDATSTEEQWLILLI